MTDAYVRSTACMGTVVTVHVVGGSAARADREQSVARALAWFDQVERVCSRFIPESELSRLSTRIGEAVPASDTLLGAVSFALAVAEETNGAFDPTVGLVLENRGFDREHRTGTVVHTRLRTDASATFRDVRVDAHQKTIILARPLLLDLGAVAKGLAIDTAARQLRDDGFENFAIDAGGDVYVAGRSAADQPWSVGIRHPREPGAIYRTVHVSNLAVCTSGDYERKVPGDPSAHHIIDARSNVTANDVVSVTAIAPSAMVADAMATAAFALGPRDGLALLERQGVPGMLITPALEAITSPHHYWSS